MCNPVCFVVSHAAQNLKHKPAWIKNSRPGVLKKVILHTTYEFDFSLPDWLDFVPLP